LNLFYHVYHLFLVGYFWKLGGTKKHLREFKMRNWAFQYKSWSVVLRISQKYGCYDPLSLSSSMERQQKWMEEEEEVEEAIVVVVVLLDLSPVWISWWSVVVIYPSLLSSCLVHVTKSSWVWCFSSFKPKQMRWQNWQWAWTIKPSSNIIPRISAFPTHGAYKGH